MCSWEFLQAEDAAAGCDLDQTGSGNDDSSTSSIQMQIKTTTQNMQKNVKELQAYCKLFHEQNPQLELLSLGRFSYPYTKDSSKMILQRRPQPENQRKSAANDDSWLPAEFCWNILGPPEVLISSNLLNPNSSLHCYRIASFVMCVQASKPRPF